MIEFGIKGMPIPKGRPKATIRGGHATVYTPATTVKYEKHVKDVAENAGVKPIEGAVGIEMTFLFPVPSATRKKDIAGLIGQYATNVKDIDNLAKSVLDGLNGVAYIDDRQVAFLLLEKRWAKKPGVIVKIAAVERPSTNELIEE